MGLSSTPADLSIARLRSEVDGTVIGPQDAEYDAARQLKYGGMDRRPAVIVRAAGAEDVVRAIQLARDTGIDLAVRCGGHSLAGHSVVDGSIVLDVSPLKSIEIDPARQTVWAGAGLTAGELTKSLAEHGFAVPFGDTSSVGIAGIALGGGIGYLVRKHGLTIDSLLGAELVTADGRVLAVDQDSHPDLFWAIRGGGGNFGVVTRLAFRLHEVDQIYGGMLILPATPAVIAAFVAQAEAAPEELSAILNVMTAPPLPFLAPELVGKKIAMALIAYAGDPAAGAEALAPFRALATPLADMVRPLRYVELYPPEEGAFRPIVASRNMFMEHVGPAEADAIVSALDAGGGLPRIVQLRALGGAMSRVPVDATAFAHRRSRIMVNLVGFHDGSTDGETTAIQWVGGLAPRLRQGDPGAYVSFVQDDGDEWVRAAYPEPTLARLSAIKARYDPENLFHLNHNIRPAAD